MLRRSLLHEKKKLCLDIFLLLILFSIQVDAFSTTYPKPQVLSLFGVGKIKSIPLAMSGGNFFRRKKQGSDNKSNNNENEDYHDDLENHDDEEQEDTQSSYLQAAASEFTSDSDTNPNSSLKPILGKTNVDWGGEYGTLKSRVTDIEEGKTGPANALFRIVTMNSPNEVIATFVKEANPEVVAAMSSAVSSLLGGLSNPLAGLETIVKANKEKLGSLCFQLQMTGYMFRNAEYVLAIKELMKIDGSTSIQDYKAAFDTIDKDGSGFIELREIQSLLSNVYGGDTPSFEVEAFLNFFDSNKDGKISWSEFEKGLGALSAKQAADRMKKVMQQGSNRRSDAWTRSNPVLKGSGDIEEDEDDDEVDSEEEIYSGEPNVTGIIKVEMKSGKVIEVEAKEYMDELKKEAKALQEALQKERGGNGNSMAGASPVPVQQDPSQVVGGITGYIASLQGDVQSLTKGISPDVVEAMKRVVEYVVDGGKTRPKKDENAEMEIPGSALQQLALWQLVLGYKLREAEATGEYRKIMKQ